MAENGATQESPQSRLIGAGFHRRLQWWVPPGSEQAMTLEAAIAALDSGEIQPQPVNWPGVHPDTAAGCRARSEEDIDAMLGRNQPDTEPPPLPTWAEPWAEMIAGQLVARLRPVIREVVRAELRKAAES
jgi:hypothetical protein